MCMVTFRAGRDQLGRGAIHCNQRQDGGSNPERVVGLLQAHLLPRVGIDGGGKPSDQASDRDGCHEFSHGRSFRLGRNSQAKRNVVRFASAASSPVFEMESLCRTRAGAPYAVLRGLPSSGGSVAVPLPQPDTERPQPRHVWARIVLVAGMGDDQLDHNARRDLPHLVEAEQLSRITRHVGSERYYIPVAIRACGAFRSASAQPHFVARSRNDRIDKS
jgi:hypothetical protein